MAMTGLACTLDNYACLPSCRVLRYHLGRWLLLWALVNDGGFPKLESQMSIFDRSRRNWPSLLYYTCIPSSGSTQEVCEQPNRARHAVSQCACRVYTCFALVWFYAVPFWTNCCAKVHSTNMDSAETDDRQSFCRPSSNPSSPVFPTCNQGSMLAVCILLQGKKKTLNCVEGPSFLLRFDRPTRRPEEAHHHTSNSNARRPQACRAIRVCIVQPFRPHSDSMTSPTQCEPAASSATGVEHGWGTRCST